MVEGEGAIYRMWRIGRGRGEVEDEGWNESISLTGIYSPHHYILRKGTKVSKIRHEAELLYFTLVTYAMP